MGALAPARRVALELAGARRRRSAYARELLRSSDSLAQLAKRDRALATRLVMGSVAAEGELDLVIDSHLERASKLEPRVRDALRLAAFEICYLSTPMATAVDQGVELVRRVAPRAAGLANAVLRRTADEDAPAIVEAAKRLLAHEGDASDMARVSGAPEWLWWELDGSMGHDRASAYALAYLEPAPVFVAANTARMQAISCRELLSARGLEPHSTPFSSAFRLQRPQGLAASGLVAAVDVVPADLAAQAVARITAPASGASMLEVGQGRGTKTLLMGMAAREKGALGPFVGVEADAAKSVRTSERLMRSGVFDGASVRCLAFDGRMLAAPALPQGLDAAFDTVFIDAPCSGTGTLRRHPEIAWSLDASAIDPANAESLPALQLELLSAASARVAEGGALVYSTCSALKQENEEVIAAFLASEQGRGFSVQSVAAAPCVTSAGLRGKAYLQERETDEGYFRSAIDATGSDAHFAARLIRASR